MTESRGYAELLRSLNSARFRTLRPAQAAVLAAYEEFHSHTADLAIELPTGAGKSLIALLIGERWREEGRPVAVLTGNKTLARQMEAEGRQLNVPVEIFEGSGSSFPLQSLRRYRRANAIAIMNYWVMFNQNPGIDSAELLVVDDAHLAESALDSLYSIEIEQFQHPILFSNLVQMLGDALPDYAVFRDAVLGIPSRAGTELISFLDHIALADRIQGIIDNAPELNTDSDLRYRWNRLRGRLREMNLYADTRTLCIRPFVYPLQANDRYIVPQQRIYMSATIGDTADLARRLGTLPIQKVTVAEETEPATLGRRLLVLNRSEKDLVPPRLANVIKAALEIQPKSLWLCNSKANAAAYQQNVMAWLEANGMPKQPSWLLTSMGNEIDLFKGAPTGHLFVGGRFDGMDFHQKECRLVVLATMPRAVNLQEAFASEYLRDASFMIQRLNQRIVQALGRCNRSDDDYGVYVLADPRFTATFSQESRRRGLPPSVLAEIDLAENHTELETAELVEYVQRFLRADFQAFDADLEQARADLPPVSRLSVSGASDDSADEVAGWLELFDRQNYRAAEGRFRARQAALDGMGLRELGAFAQWCEAKAAYLEGRRGDPVAAQRSIALLNEAIARGGTSSWFNRLRASVNRYHTAAAIVSTVNPDDFRSVAIRSFDDLLERVGPKKLDRWTARIEADIRSDKHDQFVAGLQELGGLLGYTCTRPGYGASTDCRWRGIFGNDREVLTWEAKIEHGQNALIDAHAVGQAHNQRTRAEAELGKVGYRVRGLIVTHLQQIDPSAASSIGPVRVMRKEALIALWSRTKIILDAYATEWVADSAAARLAAADQAMLKLPPTGWFERAITADNSLFIDAACLLSEWPSQAA